MNIPKLGKASLALLSFTTVTSADVLTGGLGTLATTLGLTSTISETLNNMLKGVGLGLLTHQVAKSIDQQTEGNQRLEDAFDKAVSNTLASVKRDFFEDEYQIRLKKRIDYWLGSGVPPESILQQKILENHFFTPLYQALTEEETIKKIIDSNQQLHPTDFIEAILKEKNIKLPSYKAEQQPLIIKTLAEGFRERFLYYLSQELKANPAANTHYHTQLLHWAVAQLESMGAGIQQNRDSLLTLLDYAQHQNLDLQVIFSQNKTTNQLLQELQKELASYREPILTTYKVRRTDIRDQFTNQSLYTNFYGREEELEHLQQFLEDERIFCWYMLSGEGGVGKSRLANQLCLFAEEIGWRADFVNPKDDPDFIWGRFRPRTNFLIVFDYVKAQLNEVAAILKALTTSDEALDRKVRVLLVDRDYDQDMIRSLSSNKTRYNYHTYSSQATVDRKTTSP